MSIRYMGFTPMTTKCIKLSRAYETDFLNVECCGTPVTNRKTEAVVSVAAVTKKDE
jgi:hypothetical protein